MGLLLFALCFVACACARAPPHTQRCSLLAHAVRYHYHDVGHWQSDTNTKLGLVAKRVHTGQIGMCARTVLEEPPACSLGA